VLLGITFTAYLEKNKDFIAQKHEVRWLHNIWYSFFSASPRRKCFIFGSTHSSSVKKYQYLRPQWTEMRMWIPSLLLNVLAELWAVTNSPVCHLSASSSLGIWHDVFLYVFWLIVYSQFKPVNRLKHLECTDPDVSVECVMEMAIVKCWSLWTLRFGICTSCIHLVLTIVVLTYVITNINTVVLIFEIVHTIHVMILHLILPTCAHHLTCTVIPSLPRVVMCLHHLQGVILAICK
jgi:hypothetical protein